MNISLLKELRDLLILGEKLNMIKKIDIPLYFIQQLSLNANIYCNTIIFLLQVNEINILS